MSFFDPKELEGFYGKSFHTISPTDAPRDEFMVGTEQIECDECGGMVETTCTHPQTRTVMEFAEYAYCQTCDLLYCRSRDPVISDVDYQYQHNRTDERDEYVCSTCKQRHPFTRPASDETKGSFTSLDSPEIVSNEYITLKCLCGTSIGLNDVSLPMELSCQNCPREYSFDLLE